MYLPLCMTCKDCIYFRDIGVGFCVSPDRFRLDPVKKDSSCPLYRNSVDEIIIEDHDKESPENLVSFLRGSSN